MAIIKNPLTLIKTSAVADIDPIYWQQNGDAYVPVVMPVGIENVNIVSSTTTDTDGLVVIFA